MISGGHQTSENRDFRKKTSPFLFLTTWKHIFYNFLLERH